MMSQSAYVISAVAMLLATVNAQDETESIFRGQSPFASFNGQSGENNPWTDGSTVGAVLGFLVFGVSYLYVVGYIFYDINEQKKMYTNLVEEDRDTIKQLNVNQDMLNEWEAELALRIAGKTGDDKLDDQLYGSAAILKPEEFKQYM